MKCISCFFCCTLMFFCTYAQTAYNLVSTPTGLQFTTPSALGTKGADSVDYNDFKGSPFWNNEWQPAVFLLSNGGGVKVDQVRLNLFTNDVYYITAAGQEMVAESENIKRVYFLDKQDSSKVVGVFERFIDIKSRYNTNQAPFCQILNEGAAKLVKLISVVMDKKMDLSVGKTQYIFNQETDYFLLRHDIFYPLKKLNKENVLAFVIPDAETENWLAGHKSKLKSENDVVAFLGYYNKGK